nr:MAG TPA: hypothetical protein [Crassvirales sp.]
MLWNRTTSDTGISHYLHFSRKHSDYTHATCV